MTRSSFLNIIRYISQDFVETELAQMYLYQILYIYTYIIHIIHI